MPSILIKLIRPQSQDLSLSTLQKIPMPIEKNRRRLK
jgi:hypothetical protein